MNPQKRFGIPLRRQSIVVFILVTAMTLYSAVTALAVHELGLFELDGNVADGGAAGDDWANIYAGSDSAAKSVLVFDDGPDGIDDLAEINYLGGGSKDDLDIPNWEWDTSPVPDKNDIMTAGAALYTSGGDTIIYFFLDRFSSGTGDADVGFWFFEGTHSLVRSVGDPTKGTFSGVHSIGDILILSEFTIGGGVSTVKVFEWVGDNNGSESSTTPPALGTGDGPLQLRFVGADCRNPDGTPKPAGDSACATVNTPNDGTIVPPWNYTDKQGTHDYGPAALYEGGVNATALNLDIGCGGTFLANTRASQSTDARLHDFAIGDFDLCSIDVQKTGDTLSKVGDPADYTITITNDGAITLFKDDITDSLFGNLVVNGVNQGNPNAWTSFNFATGTPCGASLAPGASCTIQVTRTVQAGDPDPLPNTVTVHYNNKADFSDTDVSDSDSHSVNLFYPAIAADKTGDTLSKVGDGVDYTFTLSNNSSTDTPALDCTAEDTLLGTIFDGTLPLGDTVINKSRTVQQGDPDPLNNTVTLTCSPAGFPNVLTASDSHSVNLFQPAVAVDKTGDTLSKIGDPVDYTITLSNNSSADTPALSCTATDSLLGEVFNDVLPLGDTVINQSRTVQQGDPDPLVNTVSMTCSVAGFPNVLEASDGHTTELFQPAVEVIKTGPATATRGETITYQFTINNLSSGDSPDLILDSVTDTVLGDLTATASANSCGTLASPGGTCSFTFDFTIPSVGPNPLVNVVTVHYHPAEFPNDITDDDDHTVLIPIQGCTPGFWQGGAGAPLWDEVNDPDWTGEGTNPYIHTTLFNDFFNNGPTDSRLDGLTMMDLVGSGGTSDSARRAARDMVAAYLNESAFPADFPADSLADLEAMWYAAVAGGDPALDAFHNTVSGWNSPEPPGFCPLP
jgi:hypothetical protein